MKEETEIDEATVIEESEKKDEKMQEVLALRERVQDSGRNIERDKLRGIYLELCEMVTHNYSLPKDSKEEDYYNHGLITETKIDIADLTRMLK